ncbi:MAG: efflux RND transporter periplasmic adaptor subunit [Aquimonas sp.]|nr:efflux RND transporter periplasmic adaptor subunit [Aquimonas sp.]
MLQPVPRNAFAILIAALIACSGPQARAQDAVSVAVVERAPLAETLSLSGSLVAIRDARLSPRLQGLVQSLAVDVGDVVERGQPLLRLDDTLARLQLRSSEAELEAAAAAEAEARRRVEEAEPLVAQRSLPQTELAARRAELARAAAARSAAQAQTETERERLARHTLAAPFAGTIAARFVDLGEWVEPASAVLQLVDTGSLRLEVQAPQERFADIAADTQVWIESDTRPGHRLPARVGARVPVSTAVGARSFLLQVLPVDNTHGLLPGSSAQAHFELDGSAALSLPRDALLRHPDGGFSVFVAVDRGEETVAERRPVRLGRQSGNRVEVLEGLQEGDRVVVRGNERLQDNQPIRAAAQEG